LTEAEGWESGVLTGMGGREIEKRKTKIHLN